MAYDYRELNLDVRAVFQAVFHHAASSRIDAGILKAQRRGNDQEGALPADLFLKLTDDGTRTCNHNKKKQHIEVAKKIGLTFDLTEKCLD